jgi:hypothetical protein
MPDPSTAPAGNGAKKGLSSGLYTRPLEEVACVDSTAWW